MRYYNGAPDSELAEWMKQQSDARNALLKVGLRATYFPMEQQWAVFNSAHDAVTGFHDTLVEAANAALRNVKEQTS